MNRESASRPTAILILLVLVIMIDCIAKIVVDAINSDFFTGHHWNGTFLVIACMLAAVDGWYVALSDFTQGQIRWPYKLIEFVGLFTFLILPWGGISLGEPATLAKLFAWTLAGYTMIILPRRFAKEMTTDLLCLNQPLVETPSTQSRASLSALQTRILWGGVPMLIAIGSARLSQTESTMNLPGSAIAVFVYSVISLLLLGQARFAILHNSWKISKASISLSLHSDWLRSNLLLIILIACLTFALPTPASIIPTSLPESALRPISTPGFTPTPTPTLTPTPALNLKPRPAPPEETSSDSSRKFLENVLGFIGNYLSLPLAQVVANTQTIFLCIVVSIFLWLVWGFFRRRPSTQSPTLRSGRAKQYTPPVAASKPARFTIRRALAPRDQVHAYYMSLLTRARQSGLERHPGQTPYEHTAQLISELPDSEEALSQLTQAFVEARYSQQHIEAEQVNQARTLWQRIRTKLRTYKQKSARR